MPQPSPHAPATPSARIAVVGGGLAGGLAALALARRGAQVVLLAPDPDQAEPAQALATACSYGALWGRSSCRQWRRLERLHGPLGFQRCPLAWHGKPPSAARSPLWLQGLLASALAVARVDPPRFLAALPAALAAAGVERQARVVQQLHPQAAGGWKVEGISPNGTPMNLEADQVVLAAGAGCRALWPALPERCGVSWAGVLSLAHNPGSNRWLDLVRRGWLVQPHPDRWQRPRLEARSAQLEAPEWIVDPGLAPAGDGVVVGQITLVRPGGAAGPPPSPAAMAARLRQELARFDPALAELEASYRQVPVTFCRDGQPLAGAVEGTPGLWVLSGFSGAFGLLPAAAERLAENVIAAAGSGPA